MKQDNLLQKLILAARKQTPSDAVPYAFEKRIMARVASLPKMDVSALWSRSLWRAALASSCICAAVATWSFTHVPHERTNDDISLAFEKTVFASMDQHLEDAW